MKGLSITAIGLRSFTDCLDIFHTLRKPLELNFLELAIGSDCDVNYNYQDIPLVIHDSCLYEYHYRYKLNSLQPKTWKPYADFIEQHNVVAVSLHPPLKKYCTQQELESALIKMQNIFGIPVYLEVMPSDQYWCSSVKTLIDFPLLLDVSHVNIWHQGNMLATQETCLSLLDLFSVKAIHLSHNRGFADTHDLIPDDVWFREYISQWNQNYLVTYESLPVDYAVYERLDKKIPPFN